MIKGAIFDFDGTLLDTMYEWENIGGNYLRSKGIVPENNISKILKPMSLEEAGEYFIEKYGFTHTVEEILNEVHALIADKYKYHFELKPYVIDYLDKLKENNIKMCIATATSHCHAVNALKRLGIEDYFEFVLTCSEVGHSKLNPRIYIESTERLGLNIDNVIVYEDTLSCIETAKKAGFKVIGVSDASAEGDVETIKKLCDKYILGFEELL
ncbi:HAD family hydrolase [Clostridium cylindrosporum]|uniref:HAD hydrolase, family IA n=1 Tax=Clostridium cylindrosporum DSM 605 TaxID=1121307 RepID=A0A0J8DEB0_CLOCY|nr:HAD family phosphatase [Clostridium cylindrosporum]KMT22528.1 HAD hydrolase, family IA [Clostridium cylindrosporum DSM 605]